MKYILLIILVSVMGCRSAMEYDIVTTLESTTGQFQDEIFKFKVTYTNVVIDKKILKFHQQSSHQESSGSYSTSLDVTVPLGSLKSENVSFIPNEGVGKNIVVKVSYPDSNTFVMFEGEAKTVINGTKAVKIEKIKDGYNFYNFNFSDKKEAQRFMNQLKYLLNKNSNSKLKN